MKRPNKFSLILFCVLCLVCIGLIGFNEYPRLKSKKPKITQQTESQNTTANLKSVDLPVPANNPSVTGLLLHYFFSGKVKTVNATQLSLDTEDPAVPIFTLTADSRVSKISQPYSEKTSVFIKLSQIKVGQTVDISAEYDLNAKQWLIRDIFLPTDRN